MMSTFSRLALVATTCTLLVLLSVIFSGSAQGDNDFFVLLAGNGTKSADVEKLENSTDPVVMVARIEVQQQLRKCALNITGNATPRHLDAAVRAQVQDCVLTFMPPLELPKNLDTSNKELLSSAKTPQMQDAQQFIIKAKEVKSSAVTNGHKKASHKVAAGSAGVQQAGVRHV